MSRCGLVLSHALEFTEMYLAILGDLFFGSGWIGFHETYLVL